MTARNHCSFPVSGLVRLERWACPRLKRRRRSGFPLQVRALITGLAGFPLQSVTRNA